MTILRKKVKLRWKLSFKVFAETYVYGPFLDISPFPILIKLIDFIGWIQNCVTVVGKWIFDSNITFNLPLTRGNMDYCCTNDDETKVMNSYKGVSKALGFFPKEKNMCFIKK